MQDEGSLRLIESKYRSLPGTGAATGSMSGARTNHTATLLPVGKACRRGMQQYQHAGHGGALRACTGLWTETGCMSIARFFHSPTRLSNRQVFVAWREK